MLAVEQVIISRWERRTQTGAYSLGALYTGRQMSIL
jgi:hypothetical protein